MNNAVTLTEKIQRLRDHADANCDEELAATCEQALEGFSPAKVTKCLRLYSEVL